MNRGNPLRGAALARWMVLLPVTGVLLVTAALPASAEISGVPGETRDPGIISIRAGYPPGNPVAPRNNRLTLTEPEKPAVEVASAPPADAVSGGQLAFDFNTQCWMPSNPCTPARNGTWTLVQTGGDDATLSFRLLIPARPPTGVTADGSAPQKVRLSWNDGPEPDLTGFAVFEGEQQVKTLGRDCAGGTCTTVIDYQADGVGLHTYTVRAFRSRGPGVAGEPLPSGSSNEVSATVLPGAGLPGPVGGVVPGTEASPAPGSPASASPAPPTASRSPAATRPGGSAPAANSTARRQAFSSGFSAFGPKLGVPKLPPLPQAPAVAQLPDGTFEPTLGFEDQELSETGPPGGVAARVTSTVGAAFVSEQIVRSTAGALVLLLAGAHLRRWLSTAPPE